MTVSAGPGWPRPGRPLLLVAGLLLLLWVARSVIGPFVVAGVLAYAFSPLVLAAVERTGWPRPLVVGVGFAAALAALVAVGAVVAGRLVAELQLLASGGPDSLAVALRELLGGDTVTVGGTRIPVSDLAHELQSGLTTLVATPGDALHVAGEVADLALNAFLAIIVTFYLLLDAERIPSFALRFVPPDQRMRVRDVAGRIHRVLGRWLRGQLLLIGLVAVVVYVALGPVLHVPYALALGLLTGVLEIIPLVGPLVATVLAATVAFASGGSALALTVVVLYAVLRQVEDQVVMPVVIGRAVHLHPVVTIFAVLVGLSAWGILGGLFGVPVAAALNVVLHELYPLEPDDEAAGPIRDAGVALGRATEPRITRPVVEADPRDPARGDPPPIP